MEQRLDAQENKVFNVMPRPKKDTKELPKKKKSQSACYQAKADT